MRSASTALGSRRGAGALEAALALPVLLVLLVGLLEAGWLFHDQQAITRAVRFGCRDGATAPSPLDPAAEAAAAIEAHLAEAGFRCPPGGCEAEVTEQFSVGEPFLACSLTAAHQPLTGMLPAMDAVNLTAATRKRVERTEP